MFFVFVSLFAVIFLTIVVLIGRALVRFLSVQRPLKAMALRRGWTHRFSLRGFSVQGVSGSVRWEFGDRTRASSVRRRLHLQDWHAPDLRTSGARLELHPPLSKADAGPYGRADQKYAETRLGAPKLLGLGEENVFRVYADDPNVTRAVTPNVVSLYRDWLERFPCWSSEQCFPLLSFSPAGLEVAYPERMVTMESAEAYLDCCAKLAEEFSKSR